MAEARAAFTLISQNPDSALGLAEKELVLARNTGNQRLAAQAYSTRGWAWLHKGSYEKTFPDLAEAARLFRRLHDSLDEMHVYVNTGMAYASHSEYAKSAKYLFIADSLAEALNDERAKAEIKRQMGILYREQGQYRKAIPNFGESMRMFRNLHDTVHFFGSASSLSAVYMAMSLPDSSLVLLQECLPLVEALHGAAYEKGMLQEHLGDAWFGLSRYDKAMESYDRAYTLFLACHDKADMAYEAMNLGKAFTRLKNYSQAENYLLLSYRTNDSLRMANYALDAAEQLANLFKATGDWRKAYQWLAIRDSLKDSLDLTALNEKTAQLQAQYEADKKEKEISLLKKDQELSHAIVQRQKVFQRGAVVVLVLLVLIGLLIFARYRAVHKARRLIELERMRNHIARDLHDDMGSALSSIHIISRTPVAVDGVEQKASDRLRKIHEHSALILENMSDIVWTINPANDTLEKTIFKMREFAADIFDPLNIDYCFNQEGDFHPVRLGLQTRKDLYLIFKEAVNNAAKYSGCSSVDILVAADDRIVSVQVRDNGIGFNRSEIRCGNGLKNMEQRARNIRGDLAITSRPGEGTTVNLEIRSHE
jgi:two-component system, NarL family, sensor histidine kinase UhpB